MTWRGCVALTICRYGGWSVEKMGCTEPLNLSVNTSDRCTEETAMWYCTHTRLVDERTTLSTSGWSVEHVSIAVNNGRGRDVNEARVSWGQGRGQKLWGQGRGQKKSCEAEANIYEAEAMRPVTPMHLHSTTKNLFSLTLKIQLLQHTIVSICYLCHIRITHSHYTSGMPVPAARHLTSWHGLVSSLNHSVRRWGQDAWGQGHYRMRPRPTIVRPRPHNLASRPGWPRGLNIPG